LVFTTPTTLSGSPSYTGIRGQIRWSRNHPVLARRMAELAAHSARAVVLVERT